jgi:hypothetical protein
VVSDDLLLSRRLWIATEASRRYAAPHDRVRYPVEMLSPTHIDYIMVDKMANGLPRS